MSKTIQEFRIVDHGLEHGQYFQGHGVSFTDFTDSFTGIGSSALEAAQDAAEQLACAGFDATAELEAAIAALSAETTVPEECDDESELWHHVSIDVRA